ncbi:hypothetical protein ABZP36_021662 [Zizania latifolia]
MSRLAVGCTAVACQGLIRLCWNAEAAMRTRLISDRVGMSSDLRVVVSFHNTEEIVLIQQAQGSHALWHGPKVAVAWNCHRFAVLHSNAIWILDWHVPKATQLAVYCSSWEEVFHGVTSPASIGHGQSVPGTSMKIAAPLAQTSDS